jgi:hypothetical protein
MWEQLTPLDIQCARERLTALRTMTLSRHAEEIKRLDLEQGEIEAFERLAESFAQRYMNSAASQLSKQDQSPSVRPPWVEVLPDRRRSAAV